MIDPGEESIKPSDVMYQDDNVCVLKPEVKKGIIICSHYKQPPNADSLCNLGLKTGKKLQEEGVDFGRTKIHPVIFFRAPYCARVINFTSVKTEISSSYGEEQIEKPQRVYIRVDPNKTFVFSSEIRARIPFPAFHINDGHLVTGRELDSTHYRFLMHRTDERHKELYNKYYINEINKSRKLLSAYLDIIRSNELKSELKIYNLYSSEKVERIRVEYPFDNSPIERNSEILVSIPHLTRDYFVFCTR